MKLVNAGTEQRIVGLHVGGAGRGRRELLQGLRWRCEWGATKKDFYDTVAISDLGGVSHHALIPLSLRRSRYALERGEHCAVYGRMQRHRRNDSEACSTRSPSPAAPAVNPCRVAHSMKAVADLK